MIRWPRRAACLVAMLAGGLAGCEDSSTPDGVEVRVENASAVTFDEATLYTLDGALTYIDLTPGATSPYVAVSSAYRIATTRIVLDADTLRLQVIDYVGEVPLPDGRYTYVLGVSGIDSSTPHLTQELRRDQ